MSKILAVFGATGQQGGAVIDYVLNDAELSQTYKIRAITRDVNSKNAKQLEEKVEVVRADVLDRASLETALTGAHTAFAMTTPSFGHNALEIEYNNGKAIADVAVEKSVQYIIFSTLPPVKEFSGGKYTKITLFDAKAKIEQYIRSLHVKSAFYSPAFFMQNFQPPNFQTPQKSSDGTWVLARPMSPKTQSHYIDAVADTGKFVGAILAEPDKFEGKTLCAASARYSWEEVAAIMSAVTGKTIVYKQISLEEFKNNLPFEPEMFAERFSCEEEFGYYGPNSEKEVDWAASNARGRLTTLKEYLEAHPLQLE
ncbi:MAG: hypothetical protein Q9195_007192 [Heterodermia aff. obscurata]